MTVPTDELAALVADRLLAESLAGLMSPGAEEREGDMARFFEDARIAELYELPAPDFPEPSPAGSASALERYFRDTAASMSEALSSLRDELARSVPELAARFDPEGAIRAAIGVGDLFQAWRTYSGVPGSENEEVRLGFAGLVRARRDERPRPDGIQMDPPASPAVRSAGVFRWSAPKAELRAAAGELSQWYTWRQAREWQLAWGSETQQWTGKLDAAGNLLQDIVSAFTEHAHQAEERFDRRCAELRDQRGMVSYLLPADGDLDAFYATALARLGQLSRARRAGGGVTTADIVRDLLGPDIWTTCYDLGMRYGPQAALSVVLGRLRNRIQVMFRWVVPGQNPLLPKLSETLARPSDELATFCAALPGLIPADLVDDSQTSVRLQVFYPAAEQNPKLEKFILDNAAPNRVGWSTAAMHPVPTESLTAVVFSTGIGLTQMPDVRAALRASRSAVAAERPDDLMPWRRRFGRHGGQIATDSRSAAILRGMLIAMWNGLAWVTGSVRDPDTVTFRLQRSAITLDLGRHRADRFSSWGWLLRAYEDWALDVSSAESWTASELLLRSFAAPSRRLQDGPVLAGILAVGRVQAALAAEVTANDAGHWADPVVRFWTSTFAAALDTPISLRNNADNTTLRDLIAGN